MRKHDPLRNKIIDQLKLKDLLSAYEITLEIIKTETEDEKEKYKAQKKFYSLYRKVRNRLIEMKGTVVEQLPAKENKIGSGLMKVPYRLLPNWSKKLTQLENEADLRQKRMKEVIGDK